MLFVAAQHTVQLRGALRRDLQRALRLRAPVRRREQTDCEHHRLRAHVHQRVQQVVRVIGRGLVVLDAGVEQPDNLRRELAAGCLPLCGRRRLGRARDVDVLPRLSEKEAAGDAVRANYAYRLLGDADNHRPRANVVHAPAAQAAQLHRRKQLAQYSRFSFETSRSVSTRSACAKITRPGYCGLLEPERPPVKHTPRDWLV